MAYLLAVLVFVSTITTAPAAGIYRWIDDAGRVHYGAIVPGAQKQKAKPVDLRAAQSTHAERAAAEARLARERATAEDMRRRREQATPLPPAVMPAPKTAATTDGSAKLTCAQEWQRFEASGACFAPYRLANNGIKAEAFQHCTQLPMPKCIPPVAPSSER